MNLYPKFKKHWKSLTIWHFSKPLSVCTLHVCHMEGRTDQWKFYTFMLELIALLAVTRPGRLYCFTMDNLNLHKHAMIVMMIMNAIHCITFCVPYWSWDNAIEYVCNTIQRRLQMKTEGATDVFDLVNKINNIIGNIPSFKRFST